MFREARSDIPMFVAIGNHDTGIYYHWAQSDGAVYTLAGDFMYKNFTALSESNDTVFGSKANGGYCYRDFHNKKRHGRNRPRRAFYHIKIKGALPANPRGI